MALAAARALASHSTLPAREIAREAMMIASTLDIYTNDSICVESL
jgi:ATP-dependent HslUV protease subunit HslV